VSDGAVRRFSRATSTEADRGAGAHPRAGKLEAEPAAEMSEGTRTSNPHVATANVRPYRNLRTLIRYCPSRHSRKLVDGVHARPVVGISAEDWKNRLVLATDLRMRPRELLQRALEVSGKLARTSNPLIASQNAFAGRSPGPQFGEQVTCGPGSALRNIHSAPFDLREDRGIAHFEMVLQLVGAHDPGDRDAGFLEDEVFLVQVCALHHLAEVYARLGYGETVYTVMCAATGGFRDSALPPP
jgi:hypothetical protein